VTEEEAWAEATRLNRERGEQIVTTRRLNMNAYYMAVEVEPGVWEAQLSTKDPETRSVRWFAAIIDFLAPWR
jgi:hypothetical protein